MIESIIPFERSYWVLPNKLLAGEIPSSKEVTKRKGKIINLIDCEIDTVINLMEENESDFNGKILEDYTKLALNQASEKNKNIEIFRFPIKDLSIPSVELMINILNKIDELIAEGRKVYVHCWGGVGRTGTVIGCYLIRNGFSSPEKIVDTINYLKRTTSIANRSSPETNEQTLFILNWSKGK